MKNNEFRRKVGIQFFASAPDRVAEIEQRLSAIKTEMEAPEADLDALTTEVDSLTEERKGLLEKAEQRRVLLDKIGKGEEGTEVRRFQPEETKPEQRTYDASSPEYRSAWLRSVMNAKQDDFRLTGEEERAFSTVQASAGPVIPTQTANEILKKVHQYAPILDKLTILRVPGYVKYAVESDQPDPTYHAENAEITATEAGLTEIVLHAYEITKLVQISKSVSMMSIDAFENWLTDMIARGLAKVISGTILNGTGVSQGKGIENANTWGATNSISVSGTLTAKHVFDLVSLLPGGYDPEACFLMSKKTLYSDFMPLQDKSKNDLVQHEGVGYRVLGYPVLLDERITDHEAYLVDLSTVIANMPEGITITSDFDIRHNAFLYMGCAMFDCIPSQPDAVRKLIGSSEP